MRGARKGAISITALIKKMVESFNLLQIIFYIFFIDNRTQTKKPSEGKSC